MPLSDFQFSYLGRNYSFQAHHPLDISLPIVGGVDNPNCYYAEAVQYDVIRFGAFVGSVAEGGSCNYQKVSFTPHGNGTHTECFGHISADKTATVYRCLNQFMFFAELISVSPEVQGSDKIIDLAQIQAKYSGSKAEALIIRTLPNDSSKKTRQYSGSNPPYLLPEVGSWLADEGIKHLLIDLPSVDREEDGGLLAMHKAFWQFPHQVRRDCTITELIFVDDTIQDGLYLLHLQVPSFELDAVPSKPVLYRLF
jgi:arylformamidase